MLNFLVDQGRVPICLVGRKIKGISNGMEKWANKLNTAC